MATFHFNLNMYTLLHFCRQILNTLSSALSHNCKLFLVETRSSGNTLCKYQFTYFSAYGSPK